MSNLKKIDEYKAFKQFLGQIRKGEQSYMVGEDYVVISKKAWESAVQNINQAILNQKVIYGKPN